MRKFTQNWQTNWEKKINKYTPVLAVVVVFGGLGTALLLSSYAATPVASIEAEAGTRNANAGVVSDTTASGGSGVKFQASSGSTVPNPLKIMPLGDSLTQGGVNGNASGFYTPTANGYRLALLNLLTTAGYHVDFVGAEQIGDASLSDQDENGYSGACIKYSPCGGGTLYPQTAGWITSENPDLIIMQGGGNDYTDPTNTDAKDESYMEQWIQLVWATKPSVKIIVSGQAQWHPELEALNKAYVQGLQAQGKPIRFVPFAATVGTDANTVDGTHPNQNGYILWANELAPMVQQLFPQ